MYFVIIPLFATTITKDVYTITARGKLPKTTRLTVEAT